ncbi:hypothetical protein BLX87_22960 [Bacillus sp. VT-16-64]|nr:hypothetical protein BLX87_22960 [Bacillus sp. VT-16-64]
MIRKKVNELIKKHKTNDPYLLADILNIHVVSRYLNHEINGFYKLEQRNKFIVINKDLCYEMQRYVCAHELGHSILHPKSNIHFLRKNTFYSVNKIETEAHKFAVELLIPDNQLKEYMRLSMYEIACIFGVPKELIKLKKFNFF